MDIGDKVYVATEGAYAFVVRVSDCGTKYAVDQSREQYVDKVLYQTAWFTESQLQLIPRIDV